MPRRATYRGGIETALHGSGLPYGYTLAVWASGQVLIESHGPPDLTAIFLGASGVPMAPAPAKPTRSDRHRPSGSSTVAAAWASSSPGRKP